MTNTQQLAVSLALVGAILVGAAFIPTKPPSHHTALERRLKLHFKAENRAMATSWLVAKRLTQCVARCSCPQGAFDDQ